MTEPLLYVLGGFVLIQLFYYLFFFTRLAFYNKTTNNISEYPGVSILVCAWNEKENLTELIPILDNQDYPEYEVILLDDRSDDGSEDYIRSNIGKWKKIRYLRINDQFEHVTPKKYALTVGMKQATYPLALMTDADCRPNSNHWIKGMVDQITDEKEIVLGFSPYFRGSGLLNWFIRCETFYTAVQYLSFALGGITYMGVGRNILYKRSVFFANKGFYTHRKVYGGDDDIFLNEVATSRNSTISLDPDSFVYSKPKTLWSDWYRQKRRHLAVSKLYRTRNKILLGLLSGAHVGVWIFGIAALVSVLMGRELIWLEILSGIWLGRWFIQLVLLVLINRKLDKTMEWFSFLPMDFALFIYYVVFGFITITRRKPRRSWN